MSASLLVVASSPTLPRPAGASATFDYAVLDSETADLAKRVAEKVRSDHRRTIQTIINTGVDLLGIKKRLGHGQFGAWLDAEFGWTERTAQRLMSAAEAFQGKSDIVSDLLPTSVYALAAPSTPVAAREEVILRRERGERLPDTAVQSIIAMAKGDQRVSSKRNRYSAQARRRIELAEKQSRRTKRAKDDWRAVAELRQAAADSAAAIIVRGCEAELSVLLRHLDDCPGFALVDAIRKAMWLREHSTDEGVAAGSVPRFVMGGAR